MVCLVHSYVNHTSGEAFLEGGEHGIYKTVYSLVVTEQDIVTVVERRVVLPAEYLFDMCQSLYKRYDLDAT